jgi:hypothetical protein
MQIPSMIALGHGDPRAKKPEILKVGVRSRDTEREGSIDIDETLLTMLVGARQPPAYLSTAPHRTPDWLTDALGSFGPPASWPIYQIKVDDAPTDFRVAEQSQDWVAVHDSDQTWLFLHSIAIPRAGIELVRVTDVTPYLNVE